MTFRGPDPRTPSSSYAVGEVQSITVNALDGGDSITVEAGPGIAVTVNAGPGNDMIVGGVGPETLIGDSGNDQIFAGGGNNTVTDGPGNDLVDLTENSAPLSTPRCSATTPFSARPFNDTLFGSSGNDRFEGRGGERHDDRGARERTSCSGRKARTRWFGTTATGPM